MRSLLVRPLAREAFAPFGEVIEAQGAKSYAINDGRATRYHDLAYIDALQAGGRPVISIFRTEPAVSPLVVRTLERHLLGSQAFVPLHGEPFLVVVAPPLAGGLPGEPLAFLTDGRQGINFKRGTWHHSLLALHGQCDFLVVDREGASEDCETAVLREEWKVALPG
jgi:ureidoglycolate lyase